MSTSRSERSIEEGQRILLLLEELCDLSYTEVLQRLNKYIQGATNAKLSFLVPILTHSDEMVIHVIGERILDRELRIPILNNILYEAVQNEKPTAADVGKLDEELLKHVKSIINQVPSSVLTIPIQHPKQQCISVVVCLIDDNKHEDMTLSATVVHECFRFCLGFLLNSLKCHEESRLKRQCQDLLAVSRKLFTHLGDFQDLLREIMAEVRNLTKAERCSLFLLGPDEQDLVAKVFDGISTRGSVTDMRIPIGQGIAGYVATTGKLLNIRDAYTHPLFYRRIDETTGFKTRNILCFPIRDEKGIVGVAQLCNKKDGLYFDVFDEEIATAFSVYCGISIMHSIVYKKMQDAQARNKLSNEVMMYHMKVEDDAVQSLLNCSDKHDIENFGGFHFCPRTVPCDHMPCCVIKMFDDLGLIKYWKIKITTLARFVLYVKKGYRNPPYHNWVHAFSVAHFAYLLMRNLRLVDEEYMTELQALVFLVSCLCHDIDHRGTNNSFQTKCGTVLASLYSSEGSVMERHHLAQTMCILNTEGCNIFECFNSEEYSEALDLLKNNILATDLASHIRAADKQKEMVRNYDKTDPKQRKLFFEMLMTCCDLSDQTKYWRFSKRTAEQIYEEFFSQGDLEKSMGSSPIEMMDRERASIPDLQIQFITNIVLPLFTNLSMVFPPLPWNSTGASRLTETLEENVLLWKIAKEIFERDIRKGMKSMDILLNPEFEEEVMRMFHLKYQRGTRVNNDCECV